MLCCASVCVRVRARVPVCVAPRSIQILHFFFENETKIQNIQETKTPKEENYKKQQQRTANGTNRIEKFPCSFYVAAVAAAEAASLVLSRFNTQTVAFATAAAAAQAAAAQFKRALEFLCFCCRLQLVAECDQSFAKQKKN